MKARLNFDEDTGHVLSVSLIGENEKEIKTYMVDDENRMRQHTHILAYLELKEQLKMGKLEDNTIYEILKILDKHGHKLKNYVAVA